MKRKAKKMLIQGIADCVAGLFVRYNLEFATKQDYIMAKKRFEFMLKDNTRRERVVSLLKRYKQKETDEKIITEIDNIIDFVEVL